VALHDQECRPNRLQGLMQLRRPGYLRHNLRNFRLYIKNLQNIVL
jgi:hypothetical protein